MMCTFASRLALPSSLGRFSFTLTDLFYLLRHCTQPDIASKCGRSAGDPGCCVVCEGQGTLWKHDLFEFALFQPLRCGAVEESPFRSRCSRCKRIPDIPDYMVFSDTNQVLGKVFGVNHRIKHHACVILNRWPEKVVFLQLVCVLLQGI